MTKALMGLFGSDRFRLAVSTNGSSLFDGLIVDNVNGIVDQPRLPRFKGYTNYDNYVAVDTWTKLGINNSPDRAAEVRERLKAKLRDQFSAGIDPERRRWRLTFSSGTGG